MGRRRHGSIVEDCPEVIGVLTYLHEKGDVWPLQWKSGKADLDTYHAIHQEKVAKFSDSLPTDLEADDDEDTIFYLTNEPDLL